MNALRWRRAAGAGLLTACAIAFGAFAQPHGTPRKPTARTAPLPPPASAQVEFVQGGTVSTPRGVAGATTGAIPVASGSTLVEGARIQVPDDGYLRLRLADGSVVRVLAQSDVELKRLRRRGVAGPVETVIDVRRGKVESEVAPKQKGRIFEIHAPGAVASVRGTRFDVSIDAAGNVGTAVTEGVVWLQARRKQRNKRTTVTAGQGVVVDAAGTLGQRRALPPQPDLSGVPTDHQDANLLVLDLASLPATQAYEVRIAVDDDLHQVLRNGTFRAARAQFPALDDGSYTVGVRAVDTEGLAGPEARRAIRVNARPVPPLYQAPPPGARVTSDAGQLACSPPAGVPWVHLQIARSDDFTQPLVDEPRLAQCRYSLGALPVGDYRWRVASVVDTGGGTVRRGPFAAPQSFTLVPTPAVAAFEAPVDSDTPTLRWAAAPGLRFHGQVARDEAFTQIVLEAELAQPSWTLTGLARGVYFVRLQARDASGVAGPVSPPHRVRVGARVQSGSGAGLTTSDGEPVSRP